jgi:hypothetical protein
VIYNLISDLVGGIEIVVLEETAGPAVTRPATPKGATRAPIRPLPTVKPMVRSKGKDAPPKPSAPEKAEKTGT